MKSGTLHYICKHFISQDKLDDGSYKPIPSNISKTNINNAVNSRLGPYNFRIVNACF